MIVHGIVSLKIFNPQSKTFIYMVEGLGWAGLGCVRWAGLGWVGFDGLDGLD